VYKYGVRKTEKVSRKVRKGRKEYMASEENGQRESLAVDLTKIKGAVVGTFEPNPVVRKANS